MACFFPNYFVQNHVNDCLLLPKQFNEPDSGIHNVFVHIEIAGTDSIYMRLYGEGLPLKHLPKILGKPKPRPHVRVERYLLPWSENKHLCISVL